jgi:hypothetical protein
MLSEEVNRARLLAINEQKKYRRDANIEVSPMSKKRKLLDALSQRFPQLHTKESSRP